jgi:hypothetical protein
MFNEIAEIVNRHHLQIRKSPDYYIKLEIGKFDSAEIFEVSTIEEKGLTYLSENYNKINQNEYYQYQYQNHFFQRQRNFKSQSFTDLFVESHIIHRNTDASNQPFLNDLRVSLHSKKPLATFSQHMSYHNIIFVNEEVWKITDNCKLYILNCNKKKQNQSVSWYEIFFKIQIPLSEQSLKEIEQVITRLSEFFTHKYGKRHKFHSLDSVLES